jgi:hypothetical protein
MQVDAVEIHELPVELPLLVGIADPSGITLDLFRIAPVRQGIAETDVAVHPSRRVDAGWRMGFAIRLVAERATRGERTQHEAHGHGERGSGRAHAAGPHFETWRKATMSRISCSLRISLVPKGGISVSGLRVRMSWTIV